MKQDSLIHSNPNLFTLAAAAATRVNYVSARVYTFISGSIYNLDGHDLNQPIVTDLIGLNIPGPVTQNKLKYLCSGND